LSACGVVLQPWFSNFFWGQPGPALQSGRKIKLPLLLELADLLPQRLRQACVAVEVRQQVLRCVARFEHPQHQLPPRRQHTLEKCPDRKAGV